MSDLGAVVVQSETLDYNADCAEFCPQPGLTHLLALGTYQLLEETQERVGRCYLYGLTFEPGPGEDDCGPQVGTPCGHARLATLDMPGIFDIKWQPPGDGEVAGSTRALLAAALADGTVRLLEADAAVSGVGSAPLRQVAQAAACSGDGGGGMCLSLDWQKLTAGAEPGARRIATSSSTGRLSVLQVAEARLEVVSEWQAHSLEAWCTAFHKSEAHILFSGADDCCFKAYDLRTPDPAAAGPVFSDRRTHSAGVCTVSPQPLWPHLVATGSYDEHVRLWDMRNLKRPVVSAQVNTGGGNWRLRWHPAEETLLVAACMYNGFGLLRCDFAFQNIEVAGMYQSPNKHIGYGVDWWQQPGAGEPRAQSMEAGGGGRSLVATCSFYDSLHTLVWFDHSCGVVAGGVDVAD